MNPRIGITCNFFHPDTERDLFKGKRLVYSEQMMASYLARHGALPFPIAHPGDLSVVEEIVSNLDGLLLSGGADVAPESYGEEATKWPGDRYQDDYELTAIRAARKKGIPILGICRGVQILNVAYGGTLYQDLLEQGVTERVHRDRDLYDQNFHGVSLEKGTRLFDLWKLDSGRVNSVHHQAVKDIGQGLRLAARSEDGVIEAVESEGSDFVVGVQWHPEWIVSEKEGLLNPKPLIQAFLNAAKIASSSASASLRRDSSQ